MMGDVLSSSTKRADLIPNAVNAPAKGTVHDPVR